MQETLLWFRVGKILWRRDRLPTPVFLGFPCGSAGKESACNVGELGLIPALGRSPGEGKDCPLQYSGLENSIDCMIYGVAESDTTNFYFHFYFINHLGKCICFHSNAAMIPESMHTAFTMKSHYFTMKSMCNSNSSCSINKNMKKSNTPGNTCSFCPASNEIHCREWSLNLTVFEDTKSNVKSASWQKKDFFYK